MFNGEKLNTSVAAAVTKISTLSCSLVFVLNRRFKIFHLNKKGKRKPQILELKCLKSEEKIIILLSTFSSARQLFEALVADQ